LASRQQYSLVPFFQTVAPSAARQLSTAWAPAADERAAEANSIASWFNFFMVLLERKK
jgi:hypothetical protein